MASFVQLRLVGSVKGNASLTALSCSKYSGDFRKERSRLFWFLRPMCDSGARGPDQNGPRCLYSFVVRGTLGFASYYNKMSYIGGSERNMDC
jgi:hypothetical protein